MASAQPKIIDINRSYVPIDPNSFPETMHGTGSEDSPEDRIPVIPYDGYNFMPTGHGYMSYFGINSLFAGSALLQETTPFDPVNVDDLFIVQTPALSNIFVALAEDGIWTKTASTDGAWSKVISLTVPATGEHLNWTKCVIGNEVHVYRASEASFWTMRAAENFVPTARVPTFLTMSAQQGIFKAGGRLGFWDSANSTAWSDVDDLTNFTPDLKTGAGAAVFQQVVGKIVNVIQHGNGFIIYATRSITVCRRTTDANYLFAAETIFNENGISYLNECCMGQPDTIHFAYTTFGIVKIENGKADYIIPEVFSYFKEKRDPVYLKILEGRFLFFQFLNPNFITGIPNFSIETVPGSSLTFKGASYAVNNISQNPCKALKAIDQNFESRYLYDTNGWTSNSQATGAGVVPIWEDRLAHNITLAIMEAYKATGASGAGSVSYFESGTYTQGTIAKIDGSGNEGFIPTNSPGLLTDYLGTPTLPLETVENNTQNFFMKQHMLWLYEQFFFDDWKDGILRKQHGDVTPALLAPTNEANTLITSLAATEKYTFGPYIDLSFFSEKNKYYGIATKSAWLQRSLTKGISIEVQSNFTITDAVETGWINGSGNGAFLFANYAAAILATGYIAHLDAFFTDTFALVSIVDIAGSAGVDRSIEIKFTRASTGSFVYTTYFYPARSTADILNITQPENERYYLSSVDFVGDLTVATGLPVYRAIVTQTFSTPKFKSVDLATCIYKNLGYTKIKGHGHYNLLGAFVVDDATPEAADYIDQCLTPPAKKKTVLFNGTQIPESLPLGCLPGPVTIDAEVYSYPDQVITLPPSTFLMQDGNIEPIYPTFEGAFVYDIQYKKWGKMVQPHKVLLNYSPVNTQAGDRPVPQEIFNVNAGCLLSDGTLAIFDKFPADSRIVWGKVGFYRKGFTDCQNVDIQFRSPATGSITVEGSLDGKNVAPSISQIVTYTAQNVVSAGFSSSARWFNVIIDGIYDVKNLDFNGNRHGKR